MTTRWTALSTAWTPPAPDCARSRLRARGTALAEGAGMSTTTFAYRDENEGARIRFRTIVDRLRQDDEETAVAHVIHSRRTGRIWAGVTGVAGMSAIALTALCTALSGAAYRDSDTLTHLLWISWPAMGAAYVMGRIWSERGTTRRRAALRETDDASADLARAEAEEPLDDAFDRADALEVRSVRLPLIALALLMPLTLHSLLVGGRGFDMWIMLSLLIVGHAHLVLAWLGARFAKEAREMSIADVETERSKAQWAAFGYTVLASALPGAILYLIPPALTAVTALCVAPVMFNLASHWITSERRALGVE
jgi:hypothetical protein